MSASDEPRQEQVVSLVSDNGSIIETTYNPARRPPIEYAIYSAKGNMTSAKSYRDFIPPVDRNGLISRGVILLPSEPAEFGSQAELVGEISGYIDRYIDVPRFWRDLMTHYCLLSWVYDRFSALPYLRLQGEPASGKTRTLQVLGAICWKAVMGGGSCTVSPLFRLLDFYRGAFVLDEADYAQTDFRAEITKILNGGYAKGLFVLRSDKNGGDYEPRAFDVYGPKIIATRRPFEDIALESRCLTLHTTVRTLRSDIPTQLPAQFHAEALELRNRLLMWRFRNYREVGPDQSHLQGLEPRAAQIASALCGVSDDPRFCDELAAFMRKETNDQRGTRPTVIVAEAIRRLLANNEEWPARLMVSDVAGAATRVGAEWEGDAVFTPRRTGELLRSLGFTTSRKTAGYRFEVDRMERLKELPAAPQPEAK
jgi:hypothetical protein